MTVSGYNSDLAAFGITRKWSVEGTRPRHMFSIKCTRCPKSEDRYYGVEPPPQQIAKQFGQKGWDVNGKRNRCPDCVLTERTAKRQEQETKMVTRDVNMKHIALVTLELEEAFDKATGRYRPGFSDEGIARKKSLAPAFVADVRRSLYGELKVDPELENLHTELKTHIEMGQELMTRLTKFMSKQAGGH